MIEGLRGLGFRGLGFSRFLGSRVNNGGFQGLESMIEGLRGEGAAIA